MSLNLNLALITKKCPIPGYFWNPGIKIQKLPEIIQNHDIFQLLRPNSSSVTKIKWNLCPICQNWQKFDQFQAISRVPENSWKFPGMMKFLNYQGQIQVQWQKLSCTDDQYFKIGQNLAISRQFPESQKIPGSFQEW